MAPLNPYQNRETDALDPEVKSLILQSILLPLPPLQPHSEPPSNHLRTILDNRNIDYLCVRSQLIHNALAQAREYPHPPTPSQTPPTLSDSLASSRSFLQFADPPRSHHHSTRNHTHTHTHSGGGGGGGGGSKGSTHNANGPSQPAIWTPKRPGLPHSGTIATTQPAPTGREVRVAQALQALETAFRRDGQRWERAADRRNIRFEMPVGAFPDMGGPPRRRVPAGAVRAAGLGDQAGRVRVATTMAAGAARGEGDGISPVGWDGGGLASGEGRPAVVKRKTDDGRLESPGNGDAGGEQEQRPEKIQRTRTASDVGGSNLVDRSRDPRLRDRN